ncbi:MAG: hypothetical protein ISQ14_14685, partial [Verrucomicrobiae bacterium]|nr:hypothetical protein [Verrucomicrobiae bacterium]
QFGVLHNLRDPATDRVDLHWRRGSLAPDVAVTGLRLASGTVAPGNVVSLAADIANTGLRSADALTVTLYGGDPDLGGAVLATQTITLDGGATIEATFSYDVPTNGIPARIFVVADPNNQLAELDETNNRTALDLQLPNWAITRGSVGFIASNRLHRVELTVANDGPLTTPATTVELRVNDAVATNGTIGALAPGATTNIVFTAHLFELLTNGPVNLVIAVDPSDAVTEVDELDNELRLRVIRISDGFSDVDGDGVDDNWELRHFAALARNGLADQDGDGVSDRDEYLADTDPNDPADRLLLELLRDTNGTRVYWNSRPGRAYRVEVSDTLGGTNNWRQGGDDRRPAGFNTRREEFQDDGSSAAQFYRVRIVP